MEFLNQYVFPALFSIFMAALVIGFWEWRHREKKK